MASLTLFGALSRFTEPRLETLSPVDRRGGWFDLFSQDETNFQRDIKVNRDEVLASPSLWSCITLIAGDIAKLRLRLEEQQAWGGWKPVASPAFSPVLRRPNRFQNTSQFVETWVLSKLIHGNAYILKERDARGVVVRLYVLDPEWVTVLVAEDGNVYYQMNRDPLSGFGEDVVVPASEIIHDRFNCLFHPLVGLSPIFAAGLPALQALKTSRHWTKFFGNNAQPGGILSAPGAISPDTATRLKKTWDSNWTGINAGRVAILGDGLSYAPLSPTAVDSQVIEQLKWSGETIAATFHIPAYKLNIGTYPSTGISALDNDYYKQCLHRLVRDFEDCLDEGLGIDVPIGTPPKQLGVGFDLAGILQLDLAARAEVAVKLNGAGVSAPDEVRSWFDWAPVKGGDKPFLQQQMWQLGQLADRTAPDDLPVDPGNPTPALPAPDAEVEARELLTQIRKGFELA